MTDERIIAYLLEELPPEEAERFEEECFSAEDWPDELRAVEDELVDDYLRGELMPERHRRFEAHYLTTAARRERVRVAAALLRHAGEASGAAKAEVKAEAKTEVEAGVKAEVKAGVKAPTFFESLRAFWGGARLRPAALAFALVAFVAAGAWLLTSAPSEENAVLLTLNVVNSERAADSPRPASVRLPRGTDSLRVTLNLPANPPPASRYRVELEGARAALTPPWVLAQDARAVNILIPVESLARGSYVLKLYAIDDDGTERRVGGSYFFDVE